MSFGLLKSYFNSLSFQQKKEKERILNSFPPLRVIVMLDIFKAMKSEKQNEIKLLTANLLI